jgi:hypothetical protein
MSVSSRAPAFVLLGLIVLAAALLIAGYGAAVGVGVLAGMALGLAAILAFLAMRPQTSGASSIAFLSAKPDQRQSGQEQIERHHHDWMRVAGVDASALHRVIAIGTGVEAGGARVEVIAIEIREDGGIAVFVAHTHPPVGQTGHIVEVTVSDDAGTPYASAGQGSGGWNSGTSRYEVRFAPAPPAGARDLEIRINAFIAPFPGPGERLEGPWEFRIALG